MKRHCEALAGWPKGMECCGNLSVIKDRINRIATEFLPQDPNLSIPRNDGTD